MKKLLLSFLLFFAFLPGTVHADEADLNLASEAAILVDTETGAVLYEKNSQQKMYPASLTKIATAIYAIEKGNLEDMVTASWNAVTEEGSRVYLMKDETLPLKQLIQGMMVNSGNDAATAIAEHLNGSEEEYSKAINKYLKDVIGVHNTHFVNAHGLFDENHYTTAADLAAITNYAMKNPVFREIFGIKYLPWKAEAWTTTLVTHHKLLKGEIPFDWEITGGKTGYVDQSRHTLATTAKSENIRLTAIVLKANVKNQMYEDTMKLLEYGFNNYRTTVIPKGQEFKKDGKVFTVDRDVAVTEDIRGTTITVGENGHLEIINSENQVIQTVPLKPVQNKAPSAESAKTNPGILSMNTVLLFLAVIAASGYVSFKRKMRNKSV